MSAALDDDDSAGAAVSVGTASGTAAASGAVDAAGGISSSDDELSDEAACGGEHITLCGALGQKT